MAFVGLNNNTIVYAQYRIWIGLNWLIPRSGRKYQDRSNTDTEYRIGASLAYTHKHAHIPFNNLPYLAPTTTR